MDRKRLIELSTSIFEEFTEGRYADLERDFNKLMHGSVKDVLVFTYSMIGIAHEASGVDRPGIVAVPRVTTIDRDGNIRQVDIEDAPLAQRTYARMAACFANHDFHAATDLWLALLAVPGGRAAMPTIASYALQEAHLQAVRRPWQAANN